MVEVTAVRPLENYQLELSFNTGEVRVFDARPYLDKGIFKQLKEPGYFQSVRVAFGTTVWPNEQDFGPDTLYLESTPAK